MDIIRFEVDIFTYFQNALLLGHRPTLLEFTHPTRRTKLGICGINPLITLEVRDNKLFQDEVYIGQALNIFTHLTLDASTQFFPAYLGYFSYEFAKYFGRPCKDVAHSFPDAFFCLYAQGLVMENNIILHHDPLVSLSLSNISTRFSERSLKSLINKTQFFGKVRDIKERIRNGDVYQVNLSLPFHFDIHDDEILAMYHAMRLNNPSPFMGIVHHDDWWLLSGSPERLLSFAQKKLSTRPIAGTKKRGLDLTQDEFHLKALIECPKENAEHAMLVDLMRNDLNHIAHPGSVRVDEDRSVEFYSHVMHLVSELSCDSTARLENIFRAIFPGGTITGAPKISVMKTIAELESVPRGPYTGSLGYISSGFGSDFNILIRSVFKDRTHAWIATGAGIVVDSDENKEWHEIKRKAMAIKDILENRAHKKPVRDVLRRHSLAFNNSYYMHKGVNILFIENHDSFSFNIIDALRSLGAQVHIAHGQKIVFDAFSHIIIGPGPGNPKNLPELSLSIKAAYDLGIPLLGICLGHQAIGHYFGAAIIKIPTPVHGKSHQVFHFGQGLFHGLLSPLTFGRYHSLAIDRAPTHFLVDAYTKDDCIMAIRHQSFSIFGIQFHPESYLSQCGQSLLHNFLRK
jgi:anthranilate synthase